MFSVCIKESSNNFHTPLTSSLAYFCTKNLHHKSYSNIYSKFFLCAKDFQEMVTQIHHGWQSVAVFNKILHVHKILYIQILIIVPWFGISHLPNLCRR